ncbi:hypothetical protein COBT_003493 [Conglomerata obtusa]
MCIEAVLVDEILILESYVDLADNIKKGEYKFVSTDKIFPKQVQMYKEDVMKQQLQKKIDVVSEGEKPGMGDEIEIDEQDLPFLNFETGYLVDLAQSKDTSNVMVCDKNDVENKIDGAGHDIKIGLRESIFKKMKNGSAGEQIYRDNMNCEESNGCDSIQSIKNDGINTTYSDSNLETINNDTNRNALINNRVLNKTRIHKNIKILNNRQFIRQFEKEEYFCIENAKITRLRMRLLSIHFGRLIFNDKDSLYRICYLDNVKNEYFLPTYKCYWNDETIQKGKTNKDIAFLITKYKIKPHILNFKTVRNHFTIQVKRAYYVTFMSIEQLYEDLKQIKNYSFIQIMVPITKTEHEYMK